MNGDNLIGNERVLRAQDCELLGNFSFPGKIDNRTRRSRFCRGLDELVAVEILSAQCDKQFARLHRARIGADFIDEYLSVAGFQLHAGKIDKLQDRQSIHKAASNRFRGAHATRVLVSATRRNNLCFEGSKKSSRWRGRHRQHAGRVRSPD